MPKWMRAALAALVMLVCANLARATDYTAGSQADPGTRKGAQNLVVDPVDSTRYLMPGNATGVFMLDQFRDRDYWSYYSKVYNDSLSNATSGKQSDSTGVFPTWQFKRKALFVYPVVHGAAGAVVRIAVQIRVHYNQTADSSNTFPLTLFTGANGVWPTISAAGTPNDSIGHLTNANRNGASGGLIGNGEFTLILHADVDMNSVAGRYPKGIYIPLPDVFAPYMSVRFWLLNPVSLVTATYVRPRLDVTFVGSAN